MKNYTETLKAIEILKQENKSKVRTVKLQMLKAEIDHLETTLEYKKGRIYPGINIVESYENENLRDFFEKENLDEIEKDVRSLKRALREAIEE